MMSGSYRVWSRFESKRSDGTVVKLRIQDLPRERIEDSLDFYCKYFFMGESMCKAAGLENNPEAVEESRLMITRTLNDPDSHYVICCEDTEEESFGDFVAMSGMVIIRPGENLFAKEKPKTEESKKLFMILNEISQRYDPLKEFNLSSIYDGRGLIVHPEYRKLGIANECIKLRREICKEHNVPATAAWISTVGSQKAAEKNKWETLCEVKYAELEEKCGVKFTDVPETCKLMIARIDV